MGFAGVHINCCATGAIDIECDFQYIICNIAVNVTEGRVLLFHF